MDLISDRPPCCASRAQTYGCEVLEDEFPDTFNEDHLRGLLAPRRTKVLAALAQVPEERFERSGDLPSLVRELMEQWGGTTFSFVGEPRSATFEPLDHQKVRYAFHFATQGDAEIVKHALKDTPLASEVQLDPTSMLISIELGQDDDHNEIVTQYERQVRRVKHFIDQVLGFVDSEFRDDRRELSQQVNNTAACAKQARKLAAILDCPIKLQLRRKEHELSDDL